MSDLSDYLENAVINHFLRASAVAAPAGVFLALYTAAPTDAGGGTEVPAANGYARQPITFGAPSPAGVTANTNGVSFTANGGNWGSITHIGVFDALTGGNLLLHRAITPAAVENGTTLSFPTGQITFTLT